MEGISGFLKCNLVIGGVALFCGSGKLFLIIEEALDVLRYTLLPNKRFDNILQKDNPPIHSHCLAALCIKENTLNLSFLLQHYISWFV